MRMTSGKASMQRIGMSLVFLPSCECYHLDCYKMVLQSNQFLWILERIQDHYLSFLGHSYKLCMSEMSRRDDFEGRSKGSLAEVTAGDVHSTILSFRKDRVENGRIFLNKSYEIQNVGLCYTTVDCDIAYWKYFDLCCECGSDSY